MKSGKKKRNVTDASESNAGDDFHILWTVQKCLELLNFHKDGLKAIAIEGLVNSDSAYIDPDGDVCLGVDLTEYYSGEDFKSANRIVISQLKYSTRHPYLEWTAARICTGKKGTTDGSIIARLASLFAGLLKKISLVEVEKKVKIKLVSNRPASLNLLNAVSSLQTALRTTKKRASIAVIQKKLASAEKKEISKIISCSKLKGKSLTAFLNALDFSDCNTDSRLDKRKNLLYTLSTFGSLDAKTQYDLLHGVIWRKMMPEAKEKNTLKLTDILYEFGLPDLESMFPVPQKFEVKADLVLREQTLDLLGAIQQSKSRLICIHGGAGLGKSTVINQVAKMASQEFHFILFDCYGGGSYLDSDDRRHKHERAFFQLSNELALKTGTPFLLNRTLNEDQYLDEFRRRFELATKTVRKNNPNGIICIVIDAADNSVNAAMEHKHSCFVHDLVKMSIPEGGRIVLTSRTERKQLLLLPEHVEEIPLKIFSNDETSKLLQHHGIILPNDKVEEFKSLTYGTPRVMSYVLEIPGTIEDKLKPLRPSGKDINDIFKSRIDVASKRSTKNDVRNFLTYAITLPRPVPLKILQKISQLTEEQIQDIGIDLWHGLIFENNRFSFRDEDFETFLKVNYIPTTTQKERIAHIILSEADKDEYASIHLAVALSNGNKVKELERIVLDRKYLNVPIDPIRSREVFIDRTRLAMKSAARDTSRLDFLRLQVIAAEANKTDQILEKILVDNAELATAHGNILTNQRIYFQSGNPGWFGSVHFRSAAIHSRDSSAFELAKEHLRKAEGWLDYRQHLPEEKRRDFEITKKDVAYGAEAMLRVFGIDACVHWLARWHPRGFVFDCIESLLQLLIEGGEANKIPTWLKGKKIRVDVQLLILNTFFRKGLTSPIDTKDILIKASAFHRRKMLKTKVSVIDALLGFCEYELIHGTAIDHVKPILDCVDIDVPSHNLSFFDRSYGEGPSDRYKIDIMFRKSMIEKYFLQKEHNLTDFYPQSLKDKLAKEEHTKKQYDRNEDKKQYDLFYGHCISIYDIRAAFLFDRLTTQQRKDILKDSIVAIGNNWELEHRFHYQVTEFKNFLLDSVSDVVFYENSRDIVNIISSSFADKKRKNTSLYLILSDKLSSIKNLEPSVVKLLKLAEAEIEADTKSASEKIDQYKVASIIASRFSKPLGKHFFDKMIQTSSEVDLDAHSQIKAFNNLTDPSTQIDAPKLAHEYARYVEYCAEHLRGWDNFPWDSAVEGICKLHLPSSIAILCRWDHRHVRKYKSHLTEVLSIALKKQFLSHEQVAALLSLNEYYWPGIIELVGAILRGFDANADHTNKSIFVKQWFYDVTVKPHHSRSGELLLPTYELIQNRTYLDSILMDEIDAYILAYKELISTDVANEVHQYSDKTYVNTENYQHNQHIKNTNVTRPEEIKDLFAKLRAASSNGYVNEKAVLRKIKDTVNSYERCQYLTALCQLNTELLSYFTFKETITELLTEWGIFPEVQAWKRDNFQNVLRALFSHFTSHDYLSTESINEFCELFGVSNTALADHLLEIIPDALDELSTSNIYNLLELTSLALGEDDKKKFIEWVVSRWHSTIPYNFGEGVYQNDFAVPDNPDTVIAGFLRYNLAHPEKRLRWRAGHALRRLVSFNNLAVIHKLISEQNKHTCFPFQDADLPFFWISAKLYFWISLERIASDYPERLAQLRNECKAALEDSNLPHALIKFFVKSTCIKLLDFNPDLYSGKEKGEILRALTSPQLQLKKQQRKRAGLAGRQRKTKFDFDSLDTVPYWYGPLGDVFGISDDEVAQIADKYIYQYFGYSGKIRDDNHFGNYDYGERSNGHGTEPRVEDLQKYYEFHSMFCAATELLQTKQVHRSEYDENEDGFKSWLDDWSTYWPDFWLSDLRDAKPLSKRYWSKDHVSNKKEWQWDIQRDDFDNIIGIKEADYLRKDYLVVSAHDTIHYGKDYETSSISSAIVSIETAPALLRSLQTSLRHDFYLPSEKDEDDHFNRNWGEERFKLNGWLRDVTRNNGSIDQTDEFYNDIGKGRIVPGSVFMEWSKGVLSKDYRFTISDNSREPLTIFESWNEGDRDSRRYDDFYSNGNRFLIKRSKLLGFLNDIHKCLVLCCDISRWPEHREYHDFHAEYHFIYLIYPDGKIETINRSYKLR